MKKIISIITVMIIITLLGLTACGKRNVTINDFEYTCGSCGDYSEIRYIEINSKCDIENFYFTYLTINGRGEVVDTYYYDAGNVLSNRTYRFLINSFGDDCIKYFGISHFDIISVSGTVKK